MGKRHRTRRLHLSNSTPAVSPPADMVQKYELLYQRTRDLEAHHVQEILVAFASGCLVLVTALASIQGLNLARRRRTQQPSATAVLHTGEPGSPSMHEPNETELPLVAPSAYRGEQR